MTKPKDPQQNTTESIEMVITAQQKEAVASRDEISEAISSTTSMQLKKQQDDISLLGRIRDRGLRLAELEQMVQQLIRENQSHEMTIISVIRSNTVAQAQLDTDRLLIEMSTSPRKV